MTERRLALIIANSYYTDSYFRQLRDPAQEAEALAKVLSDRTIGNFEVKTVINQHSDIIRKEIARFFAKRQHEDLLLLYFCCHGLKDTNNRLYFTAVDTIREELKATGISSTYVREIMEESRSR